jgi:hypothetical protein
MSLEINIQCCKQQIKELETSIEWGRMSLDDISRFGKMTPSQEAVKLRTRIWLEFYQNRIDDIKAWLIKVDPDYLLHSSNH